MKAFYRVSAKLIACSCKAQENLKIISFNSKRHVRLEQWIANETNLSIFLYIIYFLCCYVMLCNVMLCYVMLCYVMLCYVMLCYVMLCYVM